MGEDIPSSQVPPGGRAHLRSAMSARTQTSLSPSEPSQRHGIERPRFLLSPLAGPCLIRSRGSSEIKNLPSATCSTMLKQGKVKQSCPTNRSPRPFDPGGRTLHAPQRHFQPCVTLGISPAPKEATNWKSKDHSTPSVTWVYPITRASVYDGYDGYQRPSSLIYHCL